jgi:hypothetical protein
MAARAPIMHMRRDLYLCLTVCFAVSFMVATHHAANWTLWIYLGPAWVFAGLALTWDYASSKAIGHVTRLGINLGFVAVSTLIAALLFVFVPRPPVLGFGFIPPAADAPGLLGQPSAGTPGKGKGQSTGPGSGTGSGSGPSSGNADDSGTGSGWQEQWQGMLERMRPALKDPKMPHWQGLLLGQLLDWGQALSPRPDERPGVDATGLAVKPMEMPQHDRMAWLWLILLTLLALALAWLAHRYRYWLGVEMMHFGAWSLATRHPLLSMRMSARAMKWCLVDAGHAGKPGQSLREYLVSAPVMPQLSQRWFTYALELYCETRFGMAPATPKRAHNMRLAVSAATQLVKGRAPELAGP